MPPRLGVIFPQTEIGADRGGVRHYVETVRDAGYDHLLIYDHVLGADWARHPEHPRGPYDHETMFHEPFVLFGFIAALAPELELGTDVIILPQRQTALVAKQAAEVDVLCGGRLRLGVGLGWNAVEYEALGVPFRERGRRFEEQIELLRALWREPTLSYEGRFHTVTAAGISPLPVQRPIPLWIGGNAEPALRRAARLADGFFPLRPLPDHTMAETVAQVRAWVVEAGRDPGAFGIEGRIDVGAGTPDDWRAQLEQWRAMDASHVAVNTMGGGLAGPEAHAARIAEAIAALAT
jgi:probable F420-dependent oxidoreductase